MANYYEARLALFRADAKKQIQFHANRRLSMTDQQHAITPPRELIEQWASERCYDERDWLYEIHITTRAAQWGADQELEACCEWADRTGWQGAGDSLRAARRPKSTSLKEQSIALLDLIQANKKLWQLEDLDVVRRALEQLDG